jgi:hypothetical protein
MFVNAFFAIGIIIVLVTLLVVEEPLPVGERPC